MVKKTSALIVLFVLSLFLAGGLLQTVHASAAQRTTVEQTGSVISVAASQVSCPQTLCSYTPKAGDKFVGFSCAVQDTGAPDLTTNAFDWQLRDTAGGVYQAATPTFCPDISGFPTMNHVQPGDIIRGYIIYEVPWNAQLKSLTYYAPYPYSGSYTFSL